MPELSSLQTYMKIREENLKPTLDKISAVLKRIELWNEEIENILEVFQWEVEDNGFIYSSGSKLGYYQTKYGKVLVRPLIMIYTKAIDKSFEEHWITFQLLIKTQDLRDNKTEEYSNTAFVAIELLANEIYKDFTETGVYFTDEAQDGVDFDGLRLSDSSKLWNFDYAIIPKKLFHQYSKRPNDYKFIEYMEHAESWNYNIWNRRR